MLVLPCIFELDLFQMLIMMISIRKNRDDVTTYVWHLLYTDHKLTHTLQYHSCALLQGGAVKCWGFNGVGEVMPSFVFLYSICDFFQIGDGSNSNRNTPVAVLSLGSGVILLALGDVSSSDR